MNKPLPVLTPSWVERAREMIKKYSPHFDDAECFAARAILTELLEAEGYKVDKEP